MPKIRSRLAPLRRPDDNAEMRAAIDFLESHRVRFIRPTQFQLKIGDYNFYPDTGTIQLDGCKALEERGLEALQQIFDRLQDPKAPLELDLGSSIRKH